MKAVQYVQKLKSERSGRPKVETLGMEVQCCFYCIYTLFGPIESQDANPEFMKHLSEDPLEKEEEKDDNFVKSLFKYKEQVTC